MSIDIGNVRPEYVRDNLADNEYARKKFCYRFLKLWQNDMTFSGGYLCLFWIFYVSIAWENNEDSFGCLNFKYLSFSTGIIHLMRTVLTCVNYHLLKRFIITGKWHFHQNWCKSLNLFRDILKWTLMVAAVYWGITIFYLPRSCMKYKYHLLVVFSINLIVPAVIIVMLVVGFVLLILTMIKYCGLFPAFFGDNPDNPDHSNMLTQVNNLISDKIYETVEDIGIIEEKECCVCKSNTPNCRIKPCNHNAYCKTCIKKITICCLCRAKIEKIQTLKPGISPVFNIPHSKEDMA